MTHDISVVINREDSRLKYLIRDLTNLGIKWREVNMWIEEYPKGILIYEANLSEYNLRKLMNFVKNSKMGDGYEVECWDTGNSEQLW